ncbi:MAG: ThuA domain-containing protein [Clostridia bacterium]|nr:ThuA domain-containing protein [Clostridia bacterium]
MIRVLIWNEFHHEQTKDHVKAIYPEGIHGCIRDFLKTNEDLQITTATLFDENIGLSDELLENTDVLIWWGHVKHKDVPDEWVEKIKNRVLQGMGLIVLHSGHHSKIFKALMGTPCNLRWRESDDHERLWNLAPNHPVMKGIPEYFELDGEETYGERFDIPTPDELLMIGWFSGGEVFRSVCTFTRGLGRILYLQPGHETYPTFKNSYIQKLISNGIYWAAPNCTVTLKGPHEPISPEERRKSGDLPTDYVR